MTNPPPRRIVVLLSGAGSIAAALARACDDPEWGARIAAVISDKPDAGGLTWAREAGLPTAVVRPADFPDREAWDAALARTIAGFYPDYVMCAGFMRLLGGHALAVAPGRILNTHPSLLPRFPGAHAVRDALAAGVPETGCTVMVVDEGVDTGPVLAQRRVPVQPGDDEATLHERIKVVERELVVEVVGRLVRQDGTLDGPAYPGDHERDADE